MARDDNTIDELTERTRRLNELIFSLLTRNQELREEIQRLERTLEEAQDEAKWGFSEASEGRCYPEKTKP